MYFYKNMQRIFLGVLLLVFVISVKGMAQPIVVPQLPGLNKNDEHRQVVNPLTSPWKIIGRVQTDLGQKCTGFLMTPRIVVTAAHCLWIKKTRRFIRPQSVHFLLGYQRQQYEVASSVQNIIIPTTYHGTLSDHESIENIAVDMAYLVLPKPILSQTDILPIRSNAPDIGRGLWLGGYEQDRQEVLYADKKCSITGIIHMKNDALILEHNCQGTYGSSGAPLLGQNSEGKWEIIGVQVAAYGQKSGGVATTIIVKE